MLCSTIWRYGYVRKWITIDADLITAMKQAKKNFPCKGANYEKSDSRADHGVRIGDVGLHRLNGVATFNRAWWEEHHRRERYAEERSEREHREWCDRSYDRSCEGWYRR